jgi:hypothetical protein
MVCALRLASVGKSSGAVLDSSRFVVALVPLRNHNLTVERFLLDGLAMTYEVNVTNTGLRTPKAAAIAGIVFSILLLTAFGLLRISMPADPLAPSTWLSSQARTITLALNLIPFAGIAFLWFIGVLRDRLGQREDRLFATVFLGSGLLFLALLFSAAAVVGAIIIAFAARPDQQIDSDTFHFVRTLAFSVEASTGHLRFQPRAVLA